MDPKRIYQQNKWIENQKQNLSDFDQRSNLQVVKDLRKKGQSIYPVTYSANSNINIMVNNLKTLSLSGVANEEVLFCNETGEWLSYHSDELGFRNPKGVWKFTDFEHLIIGDSYGQGTCVKEKFSISGILFCIS